MSNTTKPSHTQFLSQRYFHSLDGIRCISIIAVIWVHTVKGTQVIPALQRGYLGVDMFFVLSGFLIVTLLLRERDRTGNISLWRFYVRRAARIFPLYYGILLVLSLIFIFVKPHANMAQTFFAHLPFYFTYTSNWIHNYTFLAVGWSLATEEQFYIVWPFLEKMLGNTVAIYATIFGFIGVNQLVNFRLLDNQLNAWFGIRYEDLEILQITFTPICLGVLLAHILHSKKGFQWVARWLHPTWTPAALLAIAFLACNFPGGINTPSLQRLIIQVLMTLFLASCVIQEKHWLTGILTFAPIRRIGTISYGMYLFHLVAYIVVKKILNLTGLHFSFDLFLLSLVTTIVMSELSFRFYEQPFLHLKKAFSV